MKYKILKFIKAGLPGDFDDENVRRAVITNLLGYCGLLSLTVFGINSFIVGHHTYSIIISFFWLLTVFALTHIQITKKPLVAGYFLAFLMYFLLLIMTIRGVDGNEMWGVFWYYIYPALTIFILGNKKGGIMLIFTIISAIILLSVPELTQPDYPQSMKGRFVFSYFIASLMTMAFEFVRKKTYDKMVSANKEKEEYLEQVLQQKEEIQQQKEELSAQTEELYATNIELEKLSIVAAQTDNGVAIYNANLSLIWVNEGYSKLHGYEFNELISNNENNIFNISENENIEEYIDICKTQNKSVNFVSKKTNKEGDLLWIQTTLTHIKDENNKTIQYVTIDSDITKIKKVESELNSKNKQLTDSIIYAQRIQKAVHADKSIFEDFFSDYFILFKPKNIVSGDFYKTFRKDNYTFIISADCTGHGVPGAIMSMIGHTMLDDILNNNILEPNKILDELNLKVIKTLNQNISGNKQKDGMDISIIRIDDNEKKLSIAAANQSIIHLSEDSINEIKGDFFSIGEPRSLKKNLKYNLKEISYSNNDFIYLFTDGYQDQFGGIENKKFGKHKFTQLLENIKTNDLANQKTIIEEELNNWIKTSSDKKQTDDILVIGLQF